MLWLLVVQAEWKCVVVWSMAVAQIADDNINFMSFSYHNTQHNVNDKINSEHTVTTKQANERPKKSDEKMKQIDEIIEIGNLRVCTTQTRQTCLSRTHTHTRRVNVICDLFVYACLCLRMIRVVFVVV